MLNYPEVNFSTHLNLSTLAEENTVCYSFPLSLKGTEARSFFLHWKNWSQKHQICIQAGYEHSYHICRRLHLATM